MGRYSRAQEWGVGEDEQGERKKKAISPVPPLIMSQVENRGRLIKLAYGRHASGPTRGAKIGVIKPHYAQNPSFVSSILARRVVFS